MTAKIWAMALVALIAFTLSLVLVVRRLLAVPRKMPIEVVAKTFIAAIGPQLLALGAIGSALFAYASARFRSTIGTMA